MNNIKLFSHISLTVYVTCRGVIFINLAWKLCMKDYSLLLTSRPLIYAAILGNLIFKLINNLFLYHSIFLNN